MSQLNKLYLFVHPTPRKPEKLDELMPLWDKLLHEEGPKEDVAVCMLSNSPKEMAILNGWAKEAFGDRAFIDPNDNGDETRLLIAEDLERTLQHRGNFTEWIPYEIWTSNNARRWAEGRKRDLATRGLTYDPDGLEVEAFGQQWGGCLTKYATFIPKYMGLSKTTNVNAALCPDAGFPIAARFVERIAMPDHVWLFLFETADGSPMGQFMDGLRGVWEPPHLVTVKLDPSKVEVVSSSPNGYVKADETAKVAGDTVVMDVGDGCRPCYTTVIAPRMTLDGLKTALAAGAVSALDARRRMRYSVPYADLITASRDRA